MGILTARIRTSILFALASATLGCTASGDDFSYAGRVTIARGLYGRLTWGNDMSGKCYYAPPMTVEIYADDPGNQAPPAGEPMNRGSSGPKSFFQLELAVGEYFVCPRAESQSYNVTRAFEISDTCPLVRFEYASHLWDSTICSAPSEPAQKCDVLED